MKTFHCSSAGFDCNTVIYAQNDEELLKQAAIHAEEVHGAIVTPRLVEQLKTVIKGEIKAGVPAVKKVT
ncbi:MAG: DUF1059 domain-containing protein [Bacteroidota bacterium]|nr:DUF1059 domain-containing protein [Bacteroidota bacterium]